MRTLRLFAAIIAATLMIVGCGKDNPETDKKEDKLVFFLKSTPNVSVSKDGGDATISFSANKDWSATVDSDWVKLSPTSGSGSESDQSIKVTIAANTGDERTASVQIKMTTLTAVVNITQETSKKTDGIEYTTIAQFLKKSADNNTWYRLENVEIASIANYDYGNLYIVDDTGRLYVYGLTAAKSETNDQSFSSLNLKPGDKITIVAHRSKYNETDEAGGTIPAYYEAHTPGTYKGGWKASSTKVAWMELPETKDDDGKDILVHNFYSSEFSGRSYSMYYDYDNFVSTWCAYPLTANNRGSGTRSEAYAYDPLIDPSKQANINKKSYDAGNGEKFIRGHQVPSADRLLRRENMEVFFDTNITPQSTDLNSGVWEDIEGKVREWSTKCDTLYVVTGCDVKGSTLYSLDNDGKHITAPVGYFKALLRYSKTEGYLGFAAYIENKAPKSGATLKSISMSIDELETKMGINFFCNLDEETAKVVEAEKPVDQEWWWK